MASPGKPTRPGETAGAHRLQQLIRGLALAWLIIMLIASIASYVNYQHKLEVAASVRNPYAAIQQWPTLLYYMIWFAVGLPAFAATFQRRFPLLPFYLLLPVIVEVAAFLMYFAAYRHLYQPTPRILLERFDSHPIFVAVPHPGDLGFGISHDADHRRTTVNAGKVANPRTIYVFGGSTTYDTGNTDANTWPSRLSALLGPDFAVENYGVPAFSSLEAMLQSLFVFRDRPPACALYYEGAADLRNAHVIGLRNDYSDLELPHIAAFLRPSRSQSLLASYSVLFGLIDTIIYPAPREPSVTGEVSDEPDTRLAQIYHDNMRLIAAITGQFHVRAIFVPQILNYAQLTGERIVDLPFIRAKDIQKLMAALNTDLADVAAKSGADFLAAPLSVGWMNGDFVDNGHFNAAGAQKFAASIAEDVRRLCR